MKRDATGRVRAAIGLAVLAAAWLGGCSDHPTDPCSVCSPTSVVVSDPVSPPSVASTATASPSLTSSVGDEVTYVSLPPGTIPTGQTAIIRRVGAAGTIINALSDGGFDPVAVGAQAGDSIEVVVQSLGGAGIATLALVVPARRPPKVVRSDPPLKKTDVPLNAAIVVVFSEPVTPSSLTGAMRLFRGTSEIPGTIQVLQGTGAAVAFVPSAPLAANTSYHLEVTRGVQDLEGDALDAAGSVDFTTGQSSTGPAASITLSPAPIVPDVIHGLSVYMFGATYQLTATVRDGAGNQLIDQPVTWSVAPYGGALQGVVVSATGLVTASVGVGAYDVTVSANEVAATLRFVIVEGPPASVDITPRAASVGAGGDTIQLIASVGDSSGRLLPNPSITWASSDPLLATVTADSTGWQAFATVTGVSPGVVTITATSGTASDTASVTVTQRLPVASVTLTPVTATLLPGQTVHLSTTIRDANNRVLVGRTIAWTTHNAAAATVDANGLVTAVSQGSAAITATSEGVSDTTDIAVIVLAFSSVTAGGNHTCGVTTAGAAWCWGFNNAGQLGIGAQTGPEFCRTSDTDSLACSKTPVAVSGDLSFEIVDAGFMYACGVTGVRAAYCWGNNGVGQIGDGTRGIRSSPVAVQGALTFAAVNAGGLHTCGITTDSAAYCWGYNADGQLGDGTTAQWQVTPMPVQGGLRFATVSAGGAHTCGVTTGAAAYCWGRPIVAVPGALSFATVSAGNYHTCGIATDSAAYCWGWNADGQLGDGTTTLSTMPVAVQGGLRFTAVSSGFSHTCGVTTEGAAYCWGSNTYGQLGDGTMSSRLTPVSVLGGLNFVAVSAGGSHTCGVTTGGAIYCWGGATGGQLGNGTTTNSSVPVKVAGQP